MACLNINSLVSHIDDLRVFMGQFKDIDILAINETKLDATIKDGEVHQRPSDQWQEWWWCLYLRSK